MRGYAAVAVFNPKHDANVGGVLRAAGCYGASLVILEGIRYKRQASDTLATYRHIPMLQGHIEDLVPYDCVPVGIEIVEGARTLPDYVHPERAIYIFGPEDGSIPDRILRKCRDVIAVPTKFCMNLAATVNVVLYDRISKRSLRS